MTYKAVIFDFNGTLYWDSPLHKKTWRKFSEQLRGTPFSEEEMIKYLLGRTNEEIIKYAIGKQPTPEMVEDYGSRKESLYRGLAKKDIESFHLAPGAVEFLDYLSENNIPRTIATMSDKTNVDFYIENFNVKKWFDIDKIAYADGITPGKPAPDIYLKAASNIGVSPEDCVVIEDAISGIESAKRAKIGKIIAICSEESPDLYKSLDHVSEIITDFYGLEKTIFD